MKVRHASPNVRQKSGPAGHKGGELVSQVTCTKARGKRHSTETSQRKGQNIDHEGRELVRGAQSVLLCSRSPCFPQAHPELSINHTLEVIAYIFLKASENCSYGNNCENLS